MVEVEYSYVILGIRVCLIVFELMLSAYLFFRDVNMIAEDRVDKNFSKEKKKEKLDEVDLAQMSLFDTVKDDDILEELKSVDLSNMTPIDALNKLYELQNKIKNRW